jgi:c(7)-type cytochrome triheme protein
MKKIFLCSAVLILFAFNAEAATGGGDRLFTPKDAKPVFFSHEQHVSVKGMKCSACHYHTFQMSQESYAMNMAKITKGEFCGICHNGERSFDVKDKANCVRCHK